MLPGAAPRTSCSAPCPTRGVSGASSRPRRTSPISSRRSISSCAASAGRPPPGGPIGSPRSSCRARATSRRRSPRSLGTMARSSGPARRRTPGVRSPLTYARTVLRSRPRWRAMAEIDQPRPASAWTSTSSPCVSIGRGLSAAAGLEHRQQRVGPRPICWTRPSERPDRGAQPWGVSVISSGEIPLIGDKLLERLALKGSGQLPEAA